MRFIVVALAAVFAWTVPTVARAEISQQMARMYCGPSAEVEGSLPGFEKRFEGQSGQSTSDKKGQIWVGPNGEWFVIQKIPSQGLSCVVLGGQSLTRVQNSGEL